MCQRPKRAFIISTEELEECCEALVCQRPKRAFIISTTWILKDKYQEFF